MIHERLKDWLTANGYRVDWAVHMAEDGLHVLATPGPQCVVLLHLVEVGSGFAEQPIRKVSLDAIRKLNELNPIFDVGWQGESRTASAA